MKKYGLITGASSGIGYAMSEIFAQHGIDLVLVARSIEVLQNMKKNLEKKYQIEAFILEKDLSLEASAHEVYAYTQSHNIRIDYLINNAGFGEYGAFAESDPQRNTDMINVNIVALTNLTRYYVEDMKKHNFGKILNVGSTAGFQPGPYMAVYFATKAYVQNFSLALVNELEKTNVTVTTLCPGPTESQFVQKSHAGGAQLFAGKLPSSHDVAIFGYKSMMKGKKLVVHGFMNALKAYSIKYLPISIVLKMMNYIMKK